MIVKKLLRRTRNLLLGVVPAVPAREEVAVVAPPKGSEGGVLGAFAREISKRLTMSSKVVSAYTDTRGFKTVLFMHYMYWILSPYGKKDGQISVVYVTHLEAEKHGISNEELARILGKADSLVCFNSTLRDDLVRLGVPEQKMKVVVGGVDCSKFRSSSRGRNGSVLVSTAWYERKNSSLLRRVIEELPELKFCILGGGWDNAPEYGWLLEQNNVAIIESELKHYPQFYMTSSVLLSTSSLEGGPVPLLEALASNVVPVVSETGWARDVEATCPGVSVFAVDSDPGDVASMIRASYDLDVDLTAKAKDFDWNHVVPKIQSVIVAAQQARWEYK